MRIGVCWSRHSRRPAKKGSGRRLLHRKVVSRQVPNESRLDPLQPLADEVPNEEELGDDGQIQPLVSPIHVPYLSKALISGRTIFARSILARQRGLVPIGS